jgi:hypothetical protein
MFTFGIKKFYLKISGSPPITDQMQMPQAEAFSERNRKNFILLFILWGVLEKFTKMPPGLWFRSFRMNWPFSSCVPLKITARPDIEIG